jgi:Fe2+ transport system protein FeoA
MTQIPLAELCVDEDATIFSFLDGKAVTTRLASLGLTPGAAVRMSHNYGHGPLIVTVRGAHVALGRREADRILVRQGMDE